MEHMRQAAFATVLRACGFGSLAIFCVMIGLSFEPRAAFQAGGFLTTLMAGILMFKAHEALTKNYRRTEMWLYLPEEHPSARHLCPMGELDGSARDLSPVRPLDDARFDRDVADCVVFFRPRAVTRQATLLRTGRQADLPGHAGASNVAVPFTPGG